MMNSRRACECMFSLSDVATARSSDPWKTKEIYVRAHTSHFVWHHLKTNVNTVFFAVTVRKLRWVFKVCVQHFDNINSMMFRTVFLPEFCYSNKSAVTVLACLGLHCQLNNFIGLLFKLLILESESALIKGVASSVSL